MVSLRRPCWKKRTDRWSNANAWLHQRCATIPARMDDLRNFALELLETEKRYLAEDKGEDPAPPSWSLTSTQSTVL